MKRTLRLLAAPAAAMLLLASCGTVSEPTTADASTAATASPKADEAKTADDTTETASSDDAEGDAIEEGPLTDEVDFAGETYTIDGAAFDGGKLPSAGTFYLEGLTGVKALAEVGVEGPEDLERMRELVGVDAVTYIKVDVDNREGTEEIGIYEWFMYDAEGNEYAFQTPNNQAVEWDEIIDDNSDLDLEINELAWEIDSQRANVGQRNVQWLVGPGDLPDEIAVMSASSEMFIDQFAPMPVK